MSDGTPLRPAPVLAVLFAGVLMAALDIAIVGPALPALQEQFGVGERALSWVFSIYVLLNLVGAPLLATCSDRYGRRRLFMLCVGVFAFGSAVVAAAPAFEVLLAGRAIQAFGAGGILPVASAVVADAFPAERRGRALGLIGAVFGIAFLLGPLLGGVLLRFGWQWLFLMNLPLAAVVIAASAAALPADAPRTGRRFDAAGAALLCVVLGAGALGLNAIDAEALPESLRSPAVWALLLIAVVFATWLVRVERRAPDPILPPEFLRNGRLRTIGAIGIAVGGVEAAMVFLPALAVAAFAVDAASASFMMLPLVLTLIAGAPAAGWLLDKVGPRPVIQVGLVATAAGLILFGVTSLGLAQFYAAGMLVGLGLAALLGAPLRYVVLAEAGEARRGAGQGFLTLSLGAGRLLGAAVIGALAASGDGGAYTTAFWPLAIALLATLPLTFVLDRARRSGSQRMGGAAEFSVRDEAERGS